MDNLLLYLEKDLGQKITISGGNIDLLIWGERCNDQVNILGISLTRQHDIFLDSRGERLFNIGNELSDKSGLKFIEIIYPRDLSSNPNAKLIINGNFISKDEAVNEIQKMWGSAYKKYGTKKDVNKQIADSFHLWARINLPTSYVRIDIDAILSSENDGSNIISLFEIKRSTAVKVEKWKPYKQDIRNYYLENKLSKLANLKFYTINHSCKFIRVENDTLIGLYNILNIDIQRNDIEYKRELMTAKELSNYFRLLVE